MLTFVSWLSSLAQRWSSYQLFPLSSCPLRLNERAILQEKMGGLEIPASIKLKSQQSACAVSLLSALLQSSQLFCFCWFEWLANSIWFWEDFLKHYIHMYEFSSVPFKVMLYFTILLFFVNCGKMFTKKPASFASEHFWHNLKAGPFRII